MTNETALGIADTVARLPLSDMNSEREALRTLAAAYRVEKAITDKLPKTADGVSVVWNQEVWWLTSSGSVQSVRVVIPRRSPRMDDIASDSVAFTDCYSTREAALAAKGNTDAN